MNVTDSPVYRSWAGVLRTSRKAGLDVGFGSFAEYEAWCFENKWNIGKTVVRIDSGKAFSPDNCAVMTKEEFREKLRKRSQVREENCGIATADEFHATVRGQEAGVRAGPGPANVMKCRFCGNVLPDGDSRKYCSASCRKKAWTAKRSADRKLMHKTETRLCACCGKAIRWDSYHANQRFCSTACRRRYEIEKRSVDGIRRDVLCFGTEDVASSAPRLLDSLREGKGDDYFRALFELPERDQYAEMSTWTAEDHVAACQYMKAGSDDFYDSCGEEFEVVTNGYGHGAFDEEDHFDAG